jgi:hypothetical protein
VPNPIVQLHTGEAVTLATLANGHPHAIVFLRHLGCIFCWEHVGMLRDIPAAQLTFVAMASPAEAERFRAELKVPQAIICDPGKNLYAEFGLGEGSLGQLFSFETFRRGIKATMAGYRSGRPTADPRVLGGSFVVNAHGDVVWSRPSLNAADNATAAEILAALTAAEPTSPQAETASTSATARS